MTTKAKALDRLIDAIAGEDVPMTSQTVAGRLDTLADTLAGDGVTFTARDIAGRISQLADMIEDGTISIGGGGDNWEPLRDGNTHFWVESFGADDVISIKLGCTVYSPATVNDLSIDWGDGTIARPTSTTTPKTFTHTYGKPGIFVVTLKSSAELARFRGGDIFTTTELDKMRLIDAEFVKSIFDFADTSGGLEYCYRLRAVSFSGEGSIAAEMCKASDALAKVILDSGITRIGASALGGNCVTEFVLPDTITSIENNALNGHALFSVTCKAATPPTITANPFTSVEHIYVPAASVDAYKAATNWSTYADKIQAIPA